MLDSLGSAIQVGDLVNVTIPTGKMGAGNHTTGMIRQQQLPDADSIKCDVVWQLVPDIDMPLAPPRQITPTWDWMWLSSVTLTKVKTFEVPRPN